MKNPFKKLSDAAKFWKALGYYEKIKDQIEKENDMKQLLLSKRLWISVAGLALSLGDVLPPKVGAALIAFGAIVTKVIDIGIFTAPEK